MIIKLPIIEENKIIFPCFKLEEKQDHFILTLLDNSNETSFIKIICFNNINGIQHFNLFLPLKILFFNNILVTCYFFNIMTISNFSSNDDFFSKLNMHIENKYNYTFVNFNNIKDNVTQIWKFISTEYNLIIKQHNFTNFDIYLKYLWELLNLIVNASIFLIFDFPMYTNKTIKEYQSTHGILKKIINTTNIIKNIKYSIFLSNEYDILEHIKLQTNKKINNILEIIPNKKYFIKINENKYILLKIDKIINQNLIINNIEINFNKYEWYHYIPTINLPIQNIFFLLLNNKLIYSSVLSKIDNNIDLLHHDKILSFFLYKPIKSNLYFLLNKTEEIEMQLLESNNYDQQFFKYIVKKYTDLPKVLLIIKILFVNYNFPIKFNKFEIDFVFDNILYISLSNYKNLISINKQNNNTYKPNNDTYKPNNDTYKPNNDTYKPNNDTYKQNNDNTKICLINELNNIIPIKVKILYFNILKLFYQLLNSSEEYMYNTKFFYDNMYKNFIKIFFFEKSITLDLLSEMLNKPNSIEQIQNNFRNNYLLTDIANAISWSNISKKILYLNILIKNKSVYYQDKLNKIIFNDNYDNRIKTIILNPFEMLKYLNYEKEFIDWIIMFDYKINDIYFNHISLSTDDINDLGKLIYYLYNICEQDLKDNYYKLLINHSIKNPKIILYNQRINIKIRDYFDIKFNLNCGILAKHLTTLSNTALVCYDPKNEIVLLKNQLKNITKKYLKYKQKYKEIKKTLNNSESLINSIIPLDML